MAAHTAAWLLQQDWDVAVRAVPIGAAPFLLSHVGHVAFAIDPPFTTEPVLFVFDPTQLRRVTPGLKSAIAEGHRTPPTAPWSLTQSLAAVHRFLETRPWPAAGHTGPTPEQAEAEVRRRYTQFLGRSPFIRPADNNLTPNMARQPEQPDAESAMAATTGCERCEFSRATGGIVCVCGHDWSCHDGAPSSGEPCTHCPCTDMRDPAA